METSAQSGSGRPSHGTLLPPLTMRMSNTTDVARNRLVLLVATMAIAVGLGVPAQAPAEEERRGAHLLSAVERGERTCDELGDEDFVAIGEFAMGRMLGSPRAHEAMDRMMASMMAEGGLDRMHDAMGRRFAGCGRPGFPVGFGHMMGMTEGDSGMGQMMGHGYAPGQGGDGRFDAGGLTGSGMMGSVTPRDDDGNDDSAWVAATLLIFLAGTGVAVFLLVRPRRRMQGPEALDILSQRFARGEIPTDEYEQRRELLEGGRS